MLLRSLILLLLLPNPVFAQTQDLVWYVGCDENYAIDFRSGTGTLTIDTNNTYCIGYGGTSITNDSGLMRIIDEVYGFHYYNNGNFLTMPKEGCETELPSHQASILLDFPNEQVVYYFYDCDYVSDWGARPGSIRYVKMSYDSLMNNITIQSPTSWNQLIEGIFWMGKLTACRHANGRDWWLFIHDLYSATFHLFLVTPNEILGPFDQSIGKNWLDAALGQLSISPRGDKVAMQALSTVDGDSTAIQYFEFNRCTGVISNPQLVLYLSPYWSYGEHLSDGVAFSPNGRMLYLTTDKRRIYQYDTWSENWWVDSNKILVADSFDLALYAFMKLGTDGKIYVASESQTDRYISVINSPDESGPLCNVQLFADVWGANFQAFPNSPWYGLGKLETYIADAGEDKYIAAGDTVQLGVAGVNGVAYAWSPNEFISDISAAQPFVFPDSTTIYYLTLDLTDTTLSAGACKTRTDTLTVYVTQEPDTIPIELPIIIPSLLNASQTEFFEIKNLLEGNHKLEIFNTLGQVIYLSENYLNNWQIKNVAAGLYLYRLTLASGEVMKGKIVVVR